jgi:AraC family transcriptional regulator
MTPVAKAIWFIERMLERDLSLTEIARASGVSRYHLLRVFGATTGLSVMRYLRLRRLSQAAQLLVAGAPDILGVALGAGYGSHEAFTRAFRAQFGRTPEAVRAQATLADLALVEPFIMDQSLIVELEPPRFETGHTLLIAGLGDRFTFETSQGIPLLWQRLVPYLGHIPGQIGWVTYGVSCNPDSAGAFDHVAGVEVAGFDELPPELTRLRLPERRYAVFTHRGHVSRIRATTYTIWNKWLPESGRKLAKAPDFERYDDRFDPRTATGEVEIWLPIGD